MTTPYTLKKLTDVEDSAVKFGFSEQQEAHFAKDDLEADGDGCQLPPRQGRPAAGVRAQARQRRRGLRRGRGLRPHQARRRDRGSRTARCDPRRPRRDPRSSRRVPTPISSCSPSARATTATASSSRAGGPTRRGDAAPHARRRRPLARAPRPRAPLSHPPQSRREPCRRDCARRRCATPRKARRPHTSDRTTRGTLPDAAGERDRVESPERGRHRADRARDAVAEDGRARARAAGSAERSSSSTPRGDARQPEQPRLALEHASSSTPEPPAAQQVAGRSAGSSEPERVAIGTPSSGLKPMVVSTERPSRTARHRAAAAEMADDEALGRAPARRPTAPRGRGSRSGGCATAPASARAPRRRTPPPGIVAWNSVSKTATCGARERRARIVDRSEGRRVVQRRELGQRAQLARAPRRRAAPAPGSARRRGRRGGPPRRRRRGLVERVELQARSPVVDGRELEARRAGVDDEDAAHRLTRATSSRRRQGGPRRARACGHGSSGARPACPGAGARRSLRGRARDRSRPSRGGSDRGR